MGDIQKFLKACPACQLDKTDHILTTGQLQSSKIPEFKWQEINLGFITDLCRTSSGESGVFTVIDKAARKGHLIPWKENADAVRTAELF